MFCRSLWQLFYSKEITICQVPHLMLLSKIRRTCFPQPKFTDAHQEVERLLVCWSVTFCVDRRRRLSSAISSTSLQKQESNSWVPLHWKFLWELGVRSSCLFHLRLFGFWLFVCLSVFLWWPGIAACSSESSQLLSLALVP